MPLMTMRTDGTGTFPLETHMTFEQQVASLTQRIENAERACDRWRLVGQQERYMEACSTVSALDVQLTTLRATQHPGGGRLPGPNSGS
jgi:hypothetical protein